MLRIIALYHDAITCILGSVLWLRGLRGSYTTHRICSAKKGSCLQRRPGGTGITDPDQPCGHSILCRQQQQPVGWPATELPQTRFQSYPYLPNPLAPGFLGHFCASWALFVACSHHRSGNASQGLEMLRQGTCNCI